MTKHRLIVEEDYEFLTFGISCHLKDFRVAWHINQLLKFNMMRDTLNVTDRQGEEHEYAMFRHNDLDNRLHYILLNNLSESIPLVKPYRQFNLFLLVQGYIDIFDSDHFIEQLQMDPSFQLVMEISGEPLKRFQFTLFED